MKEFASVNLFIVDRISDEVLLTKLPGNHPKEPNKWGCSTAGFVLPDEQPKDAVKRKAFQELSVTLNDRNLYYIGARLVPVQETNGIEQRYVHVFVYETEGSFNFAPNPVQVQAVCFLKVADIEKNVYLDEEFTKVFLYSFFYYAYHCVKRSFKIH
jgi:isopentenyldiphosphate isomerase